MGGQWRRPTSCGARAREIAPVRSRLRDFCGLLVRATNKKRLDAISDSTSRAPRGRARHRTIWALPPKVLARGMSTLRRRKYL